MRKIWLWSLTILSCLCIAFGLGCSCGEDENKPSNIHLSDKIVSLTVGEEKLLTTKRDIDDGLELVYESSNNSVATVSDKGLVTAVGIGQAEVTVRCGQDSDTCKVNVSLNDQEPILKIPAIEGDRVQIAKNTFLDLSTVIVFNGLNFKDAEVTYIVGDSSVGTVENGIFTPVKVGETQITVKAKWQGVEDASTTKTITVKVIENIEIALNNGLDGELVLYSLDDSVQRFNVTCKENGVSAVPSYSITHGAEYVKFSDNSLQSNGRAGYAELTVTFTGASGNVYQKIIPIYIKHTVVKLDKLDNFSALDGDIIGGKTLSTLLGEKIESAMYGNGNPLNVEDNKVYGLPTDGKEVTQTTITVYGGTHAVQAEVNAYTMVIDEAEDFKIFHVGNETWADIENHDTFDGYYVLANNIDASDYVHEKVGEGYISGNAAMQAGYDYLSGLTGTFDGKGYTVDGITVNSYGLFGHINGATIKNVAFTDIRFKASSYVCLFGAYLINSTVSNVYMQLNNYGTGNNGCSTAWINVYNSTVENMLLEIPVQCNPTTNQTKNGYGSLQHMWAEKTTPNWLPTFWRNAYVISPTVLNYLGRSNYSVDAENRVGDVELPKGVKAYYQTGILRYDSYDDMKKAGLSYTSMPADYWQNVDGALVWKDKSPETDVESLDAIIENFSAYDGDINLKTAFNANDGQEIVLESAYQGTKELKIDGNKILGIKPKFIKAGGKIESVDLVPVTINGKVDGESKSVYVGIRAYTRIIDEESDMLMFSDNGATKLSEGTPLNGYYLLAKNLEMTSADTVNQFSKVELNSRVYAKSISTDRFGLTGVFDGNGYTINNMKTPRYGLFGAVNGGTVKNVAFTNVQYQHFVSYQYPIAGFLSNATIENVYVQTKKFSNRYNSTNGLLWMDAYKSTIKNVVAECPEDYAATVEKTTYKTEYKSKGFGSLSGWNGECYSGNDWKDYEKTVYDNVYVISPTVLTFKENGVGDTYVVDAANRTESSITYVLNGVRRYDTRNALKAANLDFSGMSEEFWQKQGGLITWKGKSDPPIDLSSVDRVINMFSALDGDIDLAEAFGAQKTQTVVLLSATQGGKALTVSDGKILGVKPVYVSTNGKITDVGYTVVELTGTVDGTEVNTVIALKAYTKVIKKAEDLAIFNVFKADASDAYTGNVIDGYYILENNIDASGYTHAKSAENLTSFNITQFKNNFDGYGFKGVFDGNGYAINNLTTTENGLFGVINGGTVKNVALTNVKRVTENSQAPIIAGLAIGATVENVYASTTAGIQNGAIFLDILETTIKNCVFEVSGSVTSNRATWGSLTRTATERGFTSSTFEGVYVLSDRVLTHYNNMKNSATGAVCYEVDAVNRTDAWMAENSNNKWWSPTTANVVSGIYRYNERNDMIAANLTYTLDATYWDTSSGAPVFKDLPTKTTGTVINMFSALDGDIDLAEAFGAQEGDTVD